MSCDVLYDCGHMCLYQIKITYMSDLQSLDPTFF